MHFLILIRSEKMWEELQAKVGEPLETRRQKGQIQQRRGGSHHQIARPNRQQVLIFPQKKKRQFNFHELNLIFLYWHCRWSTIAAELPGRTDNDIKNFWHTHVVRRKKPNAAAASSSMDDHQLLELAPNHQIDVIKIHESMLAFDTNSSAVPGTQPQMELWGDKFPADANCCADYADFPPLILEEEFYYPQFYYNDWIAVEDHSIMFNAAGGSIWDESFALTASDCQPQSRVCVPLDGGVYDPVFWFWNS